MTTANKFASKGERIQDILIGTLYKSSDRPEWMREQECPFSKIFDGIRQRSDISLPALPSVNLRGMPQIQKFMMKSAPLPLYDLTWAGMVNIIRVCTQRWASSFSHRGRKFPHPSHWHCQYYGITENYSFSGTHRQPYRETLASRTDISSSLEAEESESIAKATLQFTSWLDW